MDASARAGHRIASTLAVATILALAPLLSGCIGTGFDEVRADSLRAASMTVAPLVTYTLRSATGDDAAASPVWIGERGPIDGLVNPTLRLAAGTSLRLVLRDGDGETHSLGVVDATGHVLARSADVTGFGNESSLTWRPTLPGEYGYVCGNETHTMHGIIWVDAGGATNAGNGSLPPPTHARVAPSPRPSTGNTTSASAPGSFEVSGALAVRSVNLGVANVDADAVGTADDPVPLANAPAVASTRLVSDDWELIAKVGASASGAPSDTYAVSLEWNGVPAGTVFVVVPAPDPTGEVRVAFDLGPSLNDSASYVIKIASAGGASASAPPPSEASSNGGSGSGKTAGSSSQTSGGSASPVTFSLVSKTETYSTWIGSGGASDGKTNPTLHLVVGQKLTLVATEGATDTETHNIGIKAPDKSLVGKWSADIVHPGDTVKLTWTPTSPGTYTYVCKYHPKTQKGTIVVSA